MGGPINYSDADRGGDLVPNGADRYFPVVIDEAPLLTGDYWRRFSPVLAIRRDFHHCGGPTARSGIGDSHGSAGPVQAVHWVCAIGRVGG
jgi:hypothetical protein